MKPTTIAAAAALILAAGIGAAQAQPQAGDTVQAAVGEPFSGPECTTFPFGNVNLKFQRFTYDSAIATLATMVNDGKLHNVILSVPPITCNNGSGAFGVYGIDIN